MTIWSLLNLSWSLLCTSSSQWASRRAVEVVDDFGLDVDLVDEVVGGGDDPGEAYTS